MPKYYEDEPIINAFSEMTNHSTLWARAVLSTVKEAYVAPVIHGQWCLEEETFSCSNCNAIFFCGFNTKRENEIRLKECYKFCPVCGAKMDEEVKDSAEVY